MTKTLRDYTNEAYQAAAMGGGSLASIVSAFAENCDDALLLEARQRYEAVSAVPEGRCFASNIEAKFLALAIQAYEAPT